jgi:hypothetical protein
VRTTSPRRPLALLASISIVAAALALAGCGGEKPPQLDVSPAPGDGPRAIAFDPPLGASGVDPERTTLAVTFDREMDPAGWAWVVESPATAPEVGESSWDPSFRTNTVVVKLAPGRSYVVWVNSTQHAYSRTARAGRDAGALGVRHRQESRTPGARAPVRDAARPPASSP